MKEKQDKTVTKKAPHKTENPEKRRPADKDSFAFRLAYALKLRKLLSIDLINQAGIGKSTISLYINGKSMPSKERCIRIAKSLRVDPAWLLGLTPLEAIERYNEDDPYLDPELEKIRDIYNSLNKDGRKYLRDTAKMLFESKLYMKN